MELITLTDRELLRLQTAQRVLDGALELSEAAQILGRSVRQLKRLTKRLREVGAPGFASTKRSKPPNNRFDDAVRERVLELVRTDYAGFGPTFLAEKLTEHQQLTVNRETLRRWLIAAKLHRPRRRRQKPRPMRERRARFGELVQADGSPHRWFEERANACTLLLCVDDATTTVLGGLFTESESTNGYFELFDQVFTAHGLPLALYTDKHGIFRVNNGENVDDETQVQRALRTLDIELICANSPQAKGRVERINRSFQDRLVKELRIHHVCTMDAGNRFLPAFLASFNARFATQPREIDNAHRPHNPKLLAEALTKYYERTLTKDLTFQINDAIYAVELSPLHRLSSKMRITIAISRNYDVFVVYKKQRIETRFVGMRQRTGHITNSKQLNIVVDRRAGQPEKAHIPAKAHPWRTGYDPIQLAKTRAARGRL